MNSIKAREFLRTHVLGLVAIFIALSGTAIAAGDGPTASSSVVTNAKFKKLKQRVTALETTLNSPAGGDLQGTYPNLTIRNNSVNSGKIAENAVTSGKIADNAVIAVKIAANAVTGAKIATDAVTEPKIADSAVGNNELKTIDIQAGTSDNVPAGTSALVGNGGCPGGGELLSGGIGWNTSDPDVSAGSMFNFLGGWLVRANNKDGADHTAQSIGYCLPQ